MEGSAPAVFQALETSGAGAAIRGSVWVYPVANVGHVLAVVVFAAAVAVMDVRLLGAFAAAPPGDVVRAARRVALGAFAFVVLSGAVLFTAEATHLILNPVFQTKLILIALGLINVLAFELVSRRRLAGFPPHMPLPLAARAAGFLSLALWLAAVACGRSIAYF